MKIFLTGTFRSGTTLLAYMINAAGIPLKEETVNFMRFCYGRYGYDKITQPDAIRLGEDVNNRLQQRFQLSFDIDEYRRLVAAHSVPLDYAFLYGTIMRLFEGSDAWGEKTVLEWQNAGKILEMFPDMKIVHILRDPRDVLASWKKVTIAPGNDYLDCVANCYDSMLWARENKTTFGERYHVIKFEDLLASPRSETEKLCAFMEVPFHEGILEVNRFQSKMGDKKWDPNVQTEFEDNLQGISQAPLGRWKEHLTKEDIYLCELVNGALMQTYGYPLSGYQWNVGHYFRLLAMIQKSPLAYNGLMQVVHFKRGVQRYALDPLDSSTWGEVEQ